MSSTSGVWKRLGVTGQVVSRRDRLGEDGRKLDIFPSDPHIQESLDRLRANLKEAIGLDLSTTTYQQGVKLDFDAAAEKFVGNDEANALLTRKYREPFVVTEVA